jgi:Calcineurin-like phosphoesterase
MPKNEPTKRGRTIVVGDVHGCREELEELLAKVRYGAGDDLLFLGDLLSRGPDPLGVLAIMRRTGARGVRGNHDDVLLQWHAAKQGEDDPPHLGKAKRKLAEQLESPDWAVLESLELFIDLPDHELRLVHAGVVPGLPINEQPKHALLSMRYLGPQNEPIEKLGVHGEPVEKDGIVLWGRRYTGPPHVVFGHNAQREPQVHPWATGIDTAVVYGERLTAMVLEAGQRVPPPDRRHEVLFSVPAKERYYIPPAR